MVSADSTKTSAGSGRLLVIHAAIFLAFLFGFLPKILHEDSPYVVFVLSSFCIGILLVQLAVLHLAWRVLNRVPLLVYFLLAALSTANSILLYYGYAPAFLAQERSGQWLGFGFAFLIFFIVFWAAARIDRFYLLGLGFAAAIFLSILLPSFFNDTRSASSGATPASERLKKWTDIKLKQRPNVHLVSFDSMIPASLAKKLLNIDDLPYLKSTGSDAQILENTFVARQGSWNSLNSVVKMDDNANFPDGDYMNGVDAGPLYELFRSNGYKVAAGFAGIYFGHHGAHLDRYDYIPGLNTYRISLCKFQSRLALDMQVGHFGFCELIRLFDLSYVTGSLEWPTTVAKLLKFADGSPALTLHYIYNPIGHTLANHRTGDAAQIAAYREMFLTNAARAGKVVENVIQQIRATDPNAVVFVFGDHGTWLSRTIKFEDDPKFFVQDRYGVYAALPKTGNVCSAPDLSLYSKQYQTIGRVIASIVRCLAELPEMVDAAVNFADDYPFEKYLFDREP